MIELLLVGSVLVNAWQYAVNDDLKEVNASNVAAVKDFSVSLGECSDRLVNWKRKEVTVEVMPLVNCKVVPLVHTLKKGEQLTKLIRPYSELKAAYTACLNSLQI